MATNTPARAMTTEEKVAFRSEKQWSEMGLLVFPAPTVYACQINQTFDTLDRVHELIIDGGELWDIADVLPHMTCFVGSSAGTYDKGVCRVRKESTAALLYISETSGIRFENDDFLTIVDLPAIYPRDINTDGGVFRMDYDIDFLTTLQNLPVPVLGPLVSIVETTLDAYGDPEPLEFRPLDPSSSYVLGGAAISSYLFECATALSITGETTTSPVITFDTDGWHKWSCTVTDDSGNPSIGYRWICVNPTYLNVSVDEWTADEASGTWSTRVACDDGVSTIYERALCVLVSKKDYFDGVQGVYGKLDGYENIELIGWIAEKSIEQTAEFGSVEFTLTGVGDWLDKVRGFPSGLTDVSTTPTSWVEVEELTVDKALVHLLRWCTTALWFCDFTLTGDTKRVRTLAAPRGKLLSQIKTIAEETLFAYFGTNSLGQSFIQINPQVMSDADRASIPTVISLTKSDSHGGLAFDPQDIEKTSFLELSGIGPYNGTAAEPFFSHAPGAVGFIYGGDEAPANYLFDDQADCNFKAGRLLAVSNVDIDSFTVELAGNMKFLDICPLQFVEMTIDAADNPLGFGITSALCIPRRVKRRKSKESGDITTSVMLEILVTDTDDGVTYFPPTPQNENVDDEFYSPGVGGIGAFPSFDTDFPTYIPPYLPAGACGGAFNSFTANWDRSEIRGDDDVLSAFIYFPCKVRPKSYNTASPSRVNPGVHYFGDADGRLTLYGILGGARVVTAGVDFEFDPIAPVVVDGFELVLEAGLGSTITFVPLEIVSTGSVNATNAAGVNVAVVTDSLYSIEATGGPWRYQNVPPYNTFDFYNFWKGDGGFSGGDAGGIGWTHTGGGMVLGTPFGCYQSEAVDSRHARTYFYGQVEGYFNFVVSDTIYGDNMGSLGYILRNARADGRRVTLGGARIQNICPVDS